MIVPGEEQIKKFTKLFESLAYTQSRHTVFNDFLDFSLLMMRLDRKADDFSELEKRWKDPREYKMFAEMLMIYSEIADDGGEGLKDGLGDLYMEFLANAKSGQFFTPEEICTMTAEMIVGDNPPDDYSVADPACGSGRMLLAAARKNRKMWFYGSDIDLTCCKMTVLNMLFNTMRGEVAWMDTLRMEHWKSWHIRRVMDGSGRYLPYYYETGPGDTTMIIRFKNTMQPEAKEKQTDKRKPDQLTLF